MSQSVPSVSSVSSANKKRKRGLEDADYDRIEPANPYEKRYRKSVRHVGARTAAGVAARTSVRTGGGDDRDREGRAILRRRVSGAGPGTCRTSDSLRGRGQPAHGRKGLTKYASTPLSPTHNRQSLMREGLLSFAPRPHPPLSDPPPPLSDASQASKHRPILVAKKTVTYLYNFIALPATTTRTLNHN